MNVSKIGGKGNVLELEFKDATPAVMNTLRRLLSGEVPTLALEVIEIRKNGGILYDEVLAHRLGLLPLVTPVGDYSFPTQEEVTNQEYSAKSSVKATLVAKGPCTVYAKDIKFKDPKVKPVFPETPLARLLEGQEIELEATAVLGKGTEHTKWNPGLVYYHEIPKLKGKSLPVMDEQGLIAAGHDSDDFETGTGHYYLRIEAWGQLKPTEMLTLAIDEFNKTLKEFDGLVKVI